MIYEIKTSLNVFLKCIVELIIEFDFQHDTYFHNQKAHMIDDFHYQNDSNYIFISKFLKKKTYQYFQ